MAKRLSLYGLLVLWFIQIAFGQTKTYSQSESSAPYLYYYSPLINAFVIERADGTDNRIFGAGIMPADVNSVAGAGWSPSGKWFAWTAAYDEYVGYDDYHPYILNVDGKTQSTLLENIAHADMMWSPNEDVLLVKELGENHNSQSQLHLMWVDVGANQIRQSIYLQTFDCCAMGNMEWVQNGEIGIYSSLGYFYNQFVILSATKVQAITRLNVLASYGGSNAISVQGDIAYLENEQLAIENLVTGQKRLLNFDATLDTQIHWNAMGDYALFMRDSELWLFSVKEGAFQKIADQENIINTLRADWSPDGRYAVFKTSDALFNLDPQTAISTRVETRAEELSWSWAEGHDLLTYYEIDYEWFVEIHDVSTGAIETLPIWINLAFSSDRQFIGYDQWSGFYILNRNTQKITAIPPHSTASFDGNVLSQTWHPTENWLLYGQKYGQLSVVKADGSARRELGNCYQYPTCNNWLPPQVAVEELPQGQEGLLWGEPEPVISTGDFIAYVSWSPDQSLIATGRGGYPYSIYGNYDLTIWDIVNGTLQAKIPASRMLGYHHLIHWHSTSRRDYAFVSLRPIPEDNLLTTSENYSIYVDDYAGKMTIQDKETQEPLFSLSASRADFSPDGRLLATSDTYSSVQIWDTQTWELLAIINSAAGGIAFSSDGKRLAIGSGWEIQIWDVESMLENAKRLPLRSLNPLIPVE